ncbi:hypothetical protein [Hoeflea sp.]|jgi:hypothetical protein|uniref:hypothetical protein n=1 Tax=Hoeflea sp. TaxID=1940281 RepID=UPI003A9366BC
MTINILSSTHTGALAMKVRKFLAAIAVRIIPFPYCANAEAETEPRHEATRAEIMEAIWTSAEMHAGGAYASPALVLDERVRVRSGE